MDFNTAAPPATMKYRSAHDSPANNSTVADKDEKPVFFFDIDNCLYPKSLEIHRMMAELIDKFFQEHLSLSQKDAIELHYRYYREYGLAIEGLVRHHKVDALEYNSKVDDALPLEDVIKPDPELRKLIEDIDTSKVRLWLFTNAYINHGKRVVKLLQVDDLFEGITYCDYGSEKFACKPHADMFDKAMAEAGIKSNEKCYFVDDSYINCKAAEERGWKTAHLLDKNDPAPETPASKYQIRSLQELRNVFPEVFKSPSGHESLFPPNNSRIQLHINVFPTHQTISNHVVRNYQQQHRYLRPTRPAVLHTTPSAPFQSHLPHDPHRRTAPVYTYRQALAHPLLRLELRDVSSAGAHAFLRLIHASDALSNAVDTVLTHLYRGMPQSDIPGTRSVTLVLRAMDGVAYTTGLELDDQHKEIHFNTSYISSIAPARQKEEMMGVLIHEMVHCWQQDALGTAPTGLTEGVADWVRLKAGYAPPHWKRRTDCDWDAGYERTGYFLEWLEKEHGEDVVRRVNGALRACKYEEERVWKECCGKGIKELWKEYKKCFEEESE